MVLACLSYAPRYFCLRLWDVLVHSVRMLWNVHGFFTFSCDCVIMCVCAGVMSVTLVIPCVHYWISSYFCALILLVVTGNASGQQKNMKFIFQNVFTGC